MYQIIIVIHVLLGLGIIGLIMMQQGKGADAGASFGSGSAGSVFGAQGAASFLSRTTAIMAALFFVTSLGLAFLNSKKSQSVDIMAPAGQSAQPTVPVVPVDIKPTQPNNTPVDALKTPETPASAPLENASPSQAPAAVPAPVEIKPIEVPKAEVVKEVQTNNLATPKVVESTPVPVKEVEKKIEPTKTKATEEKAKAVVNKTKDAAAKEKIKSKASETKKTAKANPEAKKAD